MTFEVAVGETDLMILAERELREEARAAAKTARRQIQSHAALAPEFLSAREPLPTPGGLPNIVAAMYRAAHIAGTGPMAAVAGAVAEYVAGELSAGGEEVIVENGGDLFMISMRERLVAVTAPGSELDGRIALAVPPGERGICTSSGTVSHSASAGRANAVVIAAESAAVADAIATATANRVSAPGDVEGALQWARERAQLQQVLIICGDAVGAWGQFELRGAGAPRGSGEAGEGG